MVLIICVWLSFKVGKSGDFMGNRKYGNYWINNMMVFIFYIILIFYGRFL